MKALIIETAFLGDAVLSIALAEALKRADPSCYLTYLVRPESNALLTFAPSIDSVVAYDKYGTEAGLDAITRKAEQLNAHGFDVVFTLHESRRTGLLLDKLDAKRKIGYGSFASLTDAVAPNAGEQRTRRAARLASVLFPNADASVLPKLDVSAVAMPDALASPQQFIAIAPGSVWQTKRWPAERFAAAAGEYALRGYSVVFIGSPQDRSAMDEVLRTLRSPHVDLVGKTSIGEAAAIISRASLLIANDSAPVHIATAVGTPSVVIFGPTVRQFGFAPPQALGAVVERQGLWCRPCTSHGSDVCPIHTHECMTGISVSEVVESSARFAEFNT